MFAGCPPVGEGDLVADVHGAVAVFIRAVAVAVGHGDVEEARAVADVESGADYLGVAIRVVAAQVQIDSKA